MYSRIQQALPLTKAGMDKVYYWSVLTILIALFIHESMNNVMHHSLPTVELEVLSVGPLQRLWNGDDSIILTLSIKADMEPVFTQNTKELFVFVAAEYWGPEGGFNQVYLWDTIIEKKENTKINQQIKTTHLEEATRLGYFTYAFQGKNLKGRDYNLTMYWNSMPPIGASFTNKVVVPGFQLPKLYKGRFSWNWN
jgi:signal peptidase complex subunit 3